MSTQAPTRLRSLQARFTAMLMLVASAFTLLAGWFTFDLSEQQAHESGRATLDGLASAIENTAAIGAYSHDLVLLKELADGLASHRLVSQVRIRAAGAEVKAGVDAAASAPPAAGGVAVQRILHNPFDSEEEIGRLNISANMATLQAEARSRARTFSALLAIQSLLMAGLLYAAVRRLVTRPLENLAARLRAMPPGTPERLSLTRDHEHDEIGSLVRSGNALLGGIQNAMDSERESLRAVRVMEARYRMIFDTSSAGIFVMERSGRLVSSNPALLRILGIEAAHGDLAIREPLMQDCCAQPGKLTAMIDAAVSAGDAVAQDLELRLIDGTPRWVHCLISQQRLAVSDSPTSQALLEGVMYDITARLQTEEAMRQRAEHDGLTGLLNRLAIESRLDALLTPTPGAKAPVFSLLFIDLDGFKRVNDTLGHAAGDAVLRICADRLSMCLRRGEDWLARVGGDEFLVVMMGIGPASSVLTQVAARIIDTLGRPIELEAHSRVMLSASLGIACHPLHGRDRVSLIVRADAAMYAVKGSGKSAYAMALPTPTPGP